MWGTLSSRLCVSLSATSTSVISRKMSHHHFRSFSACWFTDIDIHGPNHVERRRIWPDSQGQSGMLLWIDDKLTWVRKVRHRSLSHWILVSFGVIRLYSWVDFLLAAERRFRTIASTLASFGIGRLCLSGRTICVFVKPRHNAERDEVALRCLRKPKPMLMHQAWFRWHGIICKCRNSRVTIWSWALVAIRLGVAAFPEASPYLACSSDSLQWSRVICVGQSEKWTARLMNDCFSYHSNVPKLLCLAMYYFSYTTERTSLSTLTNARNVLKISNRYPHCPIAIALIPVYA